MIILLSSFPLFLPLHAHSTQSKKQQSVLRHEDIALKKKPDVAVWRQSNEHLLYFWGHWICRPIFYPISIKELENIFFFHTKNEDKFLRAVQSFPPIFNFPKHLTSTKPVGRNAMLSIFFFAPQDKGQALHFWKANERNGNTFPFQRSAGFKGY